MKMVTICQQCGDKGFENAFVFCVSCLNFAVHRYCLPKLPETFDEFVHWFCVDCQPKPTKPSPLEKPCSIPSTETNHVIPDSTRVTNSRIKSKEKNVSCSVGVSRVTEEGGHPSSPSQQACDAKSKLDLSTHAQCVCDSERHQISPSQQPQPPESLDKVVLTDGAQLANDFSPPKIKSKKRETSVILRVAETEDQRHRSKPSQQHSEAQTKLDVTKCVQPTHDCSDRKKNKLKGKKKNAMHSVAEPEAQKCQSSPSQQPSEEHTKHDLCVDSSPLSENMTVHLCSENLGNELKPKKRRRLILDGDSEIGEEAALVSIADSQIASGDLSNTLERNCYLPAQPVIDPIWRGRFNICNKGYRLFDGVVSHLSSKACSKVWEEASLLPELLCVEMLPKNAVWPKSFQISEPSDENIALYFFPVNGSFERVFDQLVDDMMQEELAMRATLRNAELLIFPSAELPLLYWKFLGKYYLWGVFRGKQASSIRPADQHLVVQNRNTELVAYSNSANGVGIGKERNLTKTETLDARSPLSPLSNSSRGLAHLNVLACPSIF
ncbi:uncharacterized protein LOC130788557 isoform X1 [Actinidia eriantha]|uniref:uncharacterized protein LOC130788557 isoform X1 n=1 Tax=Actinidia eriantha TaxID=165200 RepID=UPI0025865E85|nr:uncharacterized protein LOC130788557 isoform X1 [Actinidia eriantha]XP_057505254.1 uncharacterized protein LOC130788557 isoform X1 [Actinidia eriantha]XP_057505255.1 uncharacterized protein LOC130788557 isoform X1 [Actinidia eriantha]